MAEYRVTGLSPTVIAELVAEVGQLWHEGHQARLAARPRRRAVGAVARHRFVFVDRLPATLVSLRHGSTHDVLAFWFGVDRSTITRAIGEVRPLLAQRGCTVAPDVRLRTLAEVVSTWASMVGPGSSTAQRVQAVAGLLSHQQTATLDHAPRE